jgi:hypothetical protein
MPGQRFKPKANKMATGRLSSSPAQLALHVRQRLVSQAAVTMDSLLALVQNRLTALMDEAAPSREMQIRRDAWMAYQQAKARWLAATVKAWQAALVAGPAKAAPSSANAKIPELELLGTEVVENKIIASRLALDLMEKCAKDVNDLRKRLKLLNNDEPLASTDIAHPEVLFLVLVEQWEQCGLSRDSWQLINSTVQKHFNEHMQKAYTSCNVDLVAQGVLPDIDYTAPAKQSRFDEDALAHSSQSATPPAAVPPRGRRSEDQPAPAMMQFPSGQAAGQPMAGPAGRQGRARGILEQLGNLFSGAFFGGAPAAGPMSGSGPMSGGGSVSGMGSVSSDFGAMSGGGFIPAGGAFMGGGGPGGAQAAGPAAPVAGRIAYSGPSMPLMVAMAQQPPLNAVQFVTAEGGGQVAYPVAIAQVASELRQQTTVLKSKAETDSEKTIIELVALMFQSILQEDRITPGARVWFARLQMPVLRLALADPDFFNKTDHPARQLIDHMGSCVLGLDASGIDSEELETEIKRVVQVIEQYPETGERVYVRVYEEFQTFLKQHLTKKPTTQKVMGVVEKLEQKETLTIQYTIELRDQLKDMPVRDEIRSFLFKIWAEVLAVSTVRQGKQHEQTLMLKKTATDLIWAASAKPNRADRAKVIENLPELLQCLRSGLSLLSMRRSAQEAHIKIISDTLADAFMSKTEAIADEQIQALAQRLSALDDYVDEDSGEELPLDTENIEELLGIETTELDVVNQGGGKSSQVMVEWARELALGSWFTLRYKSDACPVQFVWRSPLGHLHLFATNTGHSYLFQTVRLAAFLQDGSLEPQEQELLMTRATINALGEIAANPTRVLN